MTTNTEHNSCNEQEQPPMNSQPSKNAQSTTLQPTVFPSEYAQQAVVVVLIGPEEKPYTVHRALLAAKSPYFKAILKDCWEGKKERIKLPDISSEGFDIVVDWMYTKQLPKELSDFGPEALQQDRQILHGYKAAHMMMIDDLQASLIAWDNTTLSNQKLYWCYLRLQQVHDMGLRGTDYYEHVLEDTINNRILNMRHAPEEWLEDIEDVKENPEILVDLLRGIGQWMEKNQYPTKRKSLESDVKS